MENPSNSIELIFKRLEAYNKTSVELSKLTALEATAKASTDSISRSIVIITTSIFVLIMSIGCAIWLGEFLGKIYYGFFIVSGFYLLMAILFQLLIKKWINKPLNNLIIKKSSKSNLGKLITSENDLSESIRELEQRHLEEHSMLKNELFSIYEKLKHNTDFSLKNGKSSIGFVAELIGKIAIEVIERSPLNKHITKTIVSGITSLIELNPDTVNIIIKSVSNFFKGKKDINSPQIENGEIQQKIH